MTRTKNDDTTSRCVFRGGSWFNGDVGRVLAANREPTGIAPTYRSANFGFRTSLAGRMKR